MLWYGEVAEAAVDSAGHAGARRAGERVLAVAQQHVPLRLGGLRDTGTVDVDGSQAAVSYATRYAAILHAHPEWNYQRGRDARWLEIALDQSGRAVADAYGDEIRAKL